FDLPYLFSLPTRRSSDLNTKVPSGPRTTFNIGEIEGGTSVNSVPYEAKIKVDIRSENEEELGRLESALRESIAAGVRDEMAPPRSEEHTSELQSRFDLVC